MRWSKRDLRKAGIVIAGMLFLLMLMAWVPVSAAGAHEDASGSTTPGTGTMQATPTEDATVSALDKEKLEQEVQQLKNQNEPDPLGWLRTNAAILLSTLVVVIGGLIGLFRWFGDRGSERDKRAEERFQAAVTGLGDEKEGAKIGAAILLRTFLRPGYEQFYTQTFDLAVANLRLPRTADRPKDPDIPLPLTTLSQTLIRVFRESFPLSRDRLKQSPQFSGAERVRLDNTYLSVDELKNTWMPYLDAAYVQLDHAYLSMADLKNVWMPQAYLRKADLWRADLTEANLRGADLRNAFLWSAILHETDFRGADFRGAYLRRADLSNARLSGTDLGGADITRANLTGVDIGKVKNLVNTKMAGVKGLTKEQLEACKAKGAIIDEDSTFSSSPSAVSFPPPSQSSDVLAQSTPSTQGSMPPPDRGGSSAASSEPGSQS